MIRSLSIRSWLEPFPSHEGVAVVFDIFRCSTTIHCLKALDAGPLFVSPSLQEARKDSRVQGMRVFSELSQPLECRERFDNSPAHASTKPWESGVSALVSTTTGTPAMFAARHFEKVFVGSFNNFSVLVAALAAWPGPVTLIPAAVPDWQHVEDEVACQSVATALEGFSNMPDFVRQCAEAGRERILASARPKILAGKLSTGVDDVRIALEIDRSPNLLSLRFDDSTLAEVVKEVTNA